MMTLWAVPQLAADPLVVEVQGTLRAPVNPDLRVRVEAVLESGERHILLDLSGLRAIDAAGIGELIRAYNMVAARGGVLRIACATRRVRCLLDITGVFDLLTDAVW